MFFVNFLFFMGINTMNILPAYLVSLGAGKAVTALFSTVPILWLIGLVVFQLIRGRTLHKLKLLRWGFLCTITAMTGMLLFNQTLWLMFPFYFLTGITYGAGFTNLMSMMYDIVPAEKRHSSAAFFGISGLMTSGVASLLTQWVYHRFPPYCIFFQPLIFSFLALLLSFFIIEKNYIQVEKEAFSFTLFIKNPRVLWLSLWALLFGGGFGIFKSFMPLFTKEQIGEVDIIRFFSFFSLVGILFRFFFASRLDRISKKGVLLTGFILMAAAMFFLGRISHISQLYFLGALYGLAHSLLFPSLSAEFVKQGGNNRAAYNNIYLALFTGGTTLFSTIMGLWADHNGLTSVPFVMTILLSVIILSLVLVKSET